MLKGWFVCLLFLLSFPGLSLSTDTDLSDVIDALETPFKAQTESSAQIQDFSADFIQKSHIASIGRTQQGQGTVHFKFMTATTKETPLAKFRWEYHEPSVQEIISDGATMWVYLPENQQVIESDISQLNDQQGKNPVTFLSGLGNLSRDFLIEWGAEKTVAGGDYLLLLVPREESPLIRQIEVVVNKKVVDLWMNKGKAGKNFPILSTLVTDPNDNQTTIMFRHVRVNQKLADTLFLFERPEGVESVDPGMQMGF